MSDCNKNTKKMERFSVHARRLGEKKSQASFHLLMSQNKKIHMRFVMCYLSHVCISDMNFVARNWID